MFCRDMMGRNTLLWVKTLSLLVMRHRPPSIAFAADGTLFVSSGDGTSDSDVDRVGQDPRSLRAKILRLDVDHPADGKLYSVPRDNPFVGDARFAAETWAYGLRNPWRLTFDSASGQLWSGENGQDLWECARLVQRGANCGWSNFEGSPRHKDGRHLPKHQLPQNEYCPPLTPRCRLSRCRFPAHRTAWQTRRAH